MHDFIRTIFYFFQRAIPLALLGLAVGGAVLALLKGNRSRAGKRLAGGRAAAIVLLPCYLCGLAAVTLMNRMDGTRTGFQLYPLLAFWEAWNEFALQAWLNPLLNIAMFLPLGALLPLAAGPFRRWYGTLAAGAGLSLGIELLQYILGRGQADVDDLLCNTLGAMLGYCLCLCILQLKGKRWRLAGACAVLPVLSAAALAGVFLAYRLQPYGNLADAPIYPAHTEGVEWVQACSLSDAPGPSGVYWAEPYTKESCDDFAAVFLSRQGVEPDLDHADVIYYDNTAFYSDHRTYSLWVSYNDRSYVYTDYRVDSGLRYSDEGGTVTEAELRAALAARGIEVPDAAEFLAVDGETGTYLFTAACVVEDGVLLDGELTCRVAEGGLLYEVDNALSASTLYGDAPVRSPREAYEKLCAGWFSWRDVPAFDRLPPRRAQVTACDLGYVTDSKGFRQPVYYFTISDEQDAELRDGSGWTTFVPALTKK